MTLVVSLKYVTFMLRYDNRGEGGMLALLTFALHIVRSRPLHPAVVLIGAFAASLFYGDALITRGARFAWMLQNSQTVADYLLLPPQRVVELRTQLGV
ncbi:MAG TPA: KUP/HAK/KT family potassium transporter [Burkholderiales bacterium]|nr:KUP/HAK/KT family potassium transporter [Burkholderiales bacterium]